MHREGHTSHPFSSMQHQLQACQEKLGYYKAVVTCGRKLSGFSVTSWYLSAHRFKTVIFLIFCGTLYCFSNHFLPPEADLFPQRSIKCSCPATQLWKLALAETTDRMACIGWKSKKLPCLVLEESAVAGGLPVIPAAAPARWLQEALAFSLRPWLPGICNHGEFKPCPRDGPPIPAWRKKLRSWGSWPPSCPHSPTLPPWLCGFWSKQKPLYG